MDTRFPVFIIQGGRVMESIGLSGVLDGQDKV